jgi:omega-6 fatty acid desaturase (delta-12 desaturase)
MSVTSPKPSSTSGWRHMVAPFIVPSWRKSTIQLADTGVPFACLMAVILTGSAWHVWWVLLLSPLAAFLLVRLFMIQHDCGHGSFFPSRRANNMLGSILGVLTLTPYRAWLRNHASHHAAAGNLDWRGTGDVTTMTVAEYDMLPRREQLAYRIYRHPLIMFGIGPTWFFLIKQRIPSGHPIRFRKNWISVLATNVALIVGALLLLLTMGPLPLLLGWLPVTLMAATIGVWLFYIQHQFESTYWERKPDWDVVRAALEGSSFYNLPQPLHWLTGNIGFHHIHHLSSKVPNYHLQACHDANALFRDVPTISLWASFGCACLALWDEKTSRLVSFRSIRI